jgi:hypothetical protein
VDGDTLATPAERAFRVRGSLHFGGLPRMSRFTVFYNSIPIGHSELESGDPPMGVASGKFVPLPSYQEAQPLVIAARDTSQVHLALIVRTTEDRVLPAQGGVQIVDYSPELGTDGIELHVLGIGYPLYEELFPGRHAAYVAPFSNGRSKQQK